MTATRLPRLPAAAQHVLRTSPVSLGYVAVLAGGAVWLRTLDGATRNAVLHGASTNLHNLRHGRWSVLLSSALVLVPPVGRSLLVALPVLAGAERRIGSSRVLAVFAAGHVAATLVVAGLLEAHALPGVTTRGTVRAVDVGLSYGLLAVAGALAVNVRHPRWWLAALVLLAAYPFAQWPVTFTDWGHLFALLLGVLAGGGLRRFDTGLADRPGLWPLRRPA